MSAPHPVEEALDLSFALSVIADHFAVPVEQVTQRSVFTRDLGADSLDLIELSLRLEHEFGVAIGDDESEACPDVGSVLRLLSQKLARSQAGPAGLADGQSIPAEVSQTL